ncbi:MAG: OmpA family protein [Flavobacteriales bacterium]|jgi:chemotaxis protein MotB|nr:OmpA family protein [Flavobacteriales bacterium]
MKNFWILPVLAIGLTSCVSQKQFDELKSEKTALENQNRNLNEELATQQSKIDNLNNNYVAKGNQTKSLENRVSILETEKKYLKDQLNSLNESYNDLINTNEGAITQKAAKVKQLIADLKKREERLEKLEKLLAQKENQMQGVKEKLIQALKSYQGKGVKIHNKEGKLYVSMDNSMLFKSGRWDLNNEAKTAISKLSKVLASDPTLNVMIEGHTDKKAYNGNNFIKDNWDLSVKRATTVVRELLKNTQINKKRITAAGRSLYSPISEGNTQLDLAKNRRIEVVIIPDLTAFEKLLESK